MLMLTGGGRSLEDLRTLKNDTALNQVLKQDVLPSTDAMGDWLRRTGTRTGLDGLGRINRRAVATRIRQIGIQAHTLDGDASQIVAEKEAAHVTYKGEQGDMPMIGHLAEAGVVIHDEFREGNIAPGDTEPRIHPSVRSALAQGDTALPTFASTRRLPGRRFNDCEDTGKTFAIGGRLDALTLQDIAQIPEASWKRYADRAVAETVHSMNDTRKSFRLIVVKYPRQVELFDDAPKYPVIASKQVESAADILIWYRQRGEVSENGIKELKIGFGMERMPCGQFSANAASSPLASSRTASTSAAISSSLIVAAPAASSAGAMASRRSSALRFLTLVARNSTKSSTSATCCGETVRIFDIKLCSTVAFITILPGCGALSTPQPLVA
ncbi:MAG: transposase [Candidatus Accumulibacter sp.]|nr:transposase [Accumulibacter sp.]